MLQEALQAVLEFPRSLNLSVLASLSKLKEDKLNTAGPTQKKKPYGNSPFLVMSCDVILRDDLVNHVQGRPCYVLK